VAGVPHPAGGGGGGGKTDTTPCAGDWVVFGADIGAVANSWVRLPIADTTTLVFETFGSLTTDLSRLITVIFFPSYTFNPSLPLRVLDWAGTATKCWEDGCPFTNDSRAMCLRHFRPNGARSIFSAEAPEWVNTAHLSFYHGLRPFVFFLRPQRTNGPLVDLRHAINVL